MLYLIHFRGFFPKKSIKIVMQYWFFPLQSTTQLNCRSWFNKRAANKQFHCFQSTNKHNNFFFILNLQFFFIYIAIDLHPSRFKFKFHWKLLLEWKFCQLLLKNLIRHKSGGKRLLENKAIRVWGNFLE